MDKTKIQGFRENLKSTGQSKFTLDEKEETAVRPHHYHHQHHHHQHHHHVHHCTLTSIKITGVHVTVTMDNLTAYFYKSLKHNLHRE